MKILLGLALLLLTGCAIKSTPVPESSREWHDRMVADHYRPRLIVQVCARRKVPYVAFQTVQTTPRAGGSYSSEALRSTGTSSDAQDVYESYSAFPEYLIVNTVSFPGERLTYAFAPGKLTLSTEWSHWLRPAYVSSTENLAWHILQDRQVDLLAPDNNSPLIRYVLMSFNDYLARQATRRQGLLREVSPACDA